MLRTLSCLSFFVCLTVAGWSQGNKPPVTGVGIVYNRETTFNFRLTTNRGFATGLEFGKLRTYYKTTNFGISIGELKSTKEQRQSADPQGRSFRPYVFGKQNNLFVLRTNWGIKRYYSEKAKQKGVAIGINYSVGPTLGLLKPYYLALAYVSPDNPRDQRVLHQRYSEENADVFLNNTRILGASPFTKGFSEVSILPGANASIALHMDWGAFDEFVKAFEIGFMFDLFFKDAPIMVEQNNPMFFNFFLNLQLGKRR